MQVDAIPLSIKYKIKYPDEYIEAVKRGEIVATRCKNCGSVYFPPSKRIVTIVARTRWSGLRYLMRVK